MNRWLAEESKWCREQALKATRRAEELADPAWVSRRGREIARDQAALHELIDKHMALLGEAAMLADPDATAREIERARRDAEHWQALAEEQSARLAATEDQTEPLFEGGN